MVGMASEHALDPRRGGLRAVRALALAAVAVGPASAAHAGLQGCVSLLGVVVAGTLCWSAGVALLGARRGPRALMAWLLAAQLVTHVVLESLCADAAHGLLAHLAQSATPGMLAAHVGAALVSAVVLARSDEALWVARGLLRSLGRLLLPLLAPVVADARVPRSVRAEGRRLPSYLLCLATTSWRGPPAGLAC